MEIPEGWKLVPIEPTGDMLYAGSDNDVGGSCYSCSKWSASYTDCKNVYKSMLDASPEFKENSK